MKTEASLQKQQEGRELRILSKYKSNVVFAFLQSNVGFGFDTSLITGFLLSASQLWRQPVLERRQP